MSDDKIYFVREEGIQDEAESANEIIDRGTLICSKEGKEDTLEEGERGWHESILADGSRREYHGYNNLVETGYYECFVWEMGKGPVEYRSGYGAEAEAIALYLKKDISSNG